MSDIVGTTTLAQRARDLDAEHATTDRRRAFEGGLPLQIASRLECCGCRRSLQHHAGIWLVRGKRERTVEQRLVGDDPPGLDPA